MSVLPLTHSNYDRAANISIQASAHALTLCRAIGNRSTFIYPPSSSPPSAKLFADALQHTQVDCAFISPPIADELASNPDLLDSVTSNIHSLFVIGGDLSDSIGDKISKYTILVNLYSSSELINIPQLHPSHHDNPSEWKYLHFHPRMGVEFRNVIEDIFELIIVRHQEYEDHQPVFKLYPELQIFETGDLWSPHPNKEGLWRYRGRGEDIIMFKGGERLIPIVVEGHIATHPEVRTALIVGTGREEAVLLVELVSPKLLSGIEKLKAVERIWPVVQEANGLAPGFARVRKENIVFVDQEKPMERTPMGTVQREPTVRLYAGELDTLYGGRPVAEEVKCEVVMNGHMENGKTNVGRRGGRIGFFLS
jgi:acyl-coenzyme A synthetase/AMP-(fatty) acid ligase